MVKTIIEALFEYFENCPLMANNRLNINYLPEDTKKAGIEYSISTEPADEVMQQYKDGGARCRYPFIISSVNDYGPDAAQNMLNSGFGEELAQWLRVQSRLRNLPVLPQGMLARSIKAKGFGYLYQPEADTGKYQIQCELEYYRKGDWP
ncbi:MAG: hypothetical protein FWG40_00660 [Peptococcaceae bacterium]|nr:hypothetical protein [Peptococcaceae bacterium]